MSPRLEPLLAELSARSGKVTKQPAEPVLSENSVEPSGRSMIVAQEPAEPRPAADRVGRSARRVGNQSVVQALVIPFPVIVRSELAKRPA